MENWEIDFYWLEVRHKVKEVFKKEKLPDLNTILLAIGINELGFVKEQFTRKEKEDLMHIAVCRLLSYDGYVEFSGIDDDGWPHWKDLKPFDRKGLVQQEKWLKAKIIQYFSHLQILNTQKWSQN